MLDGVQIYSAVLRRDQRQLTARYPPVGVGRLELLPFGEVRLDESEVDAGAVERQPHIRAVALTEERADTPST